jgi:hypothetical protein
MTDQDLDRLLAASAVRDRDLAGLDLRAGERDLLEEIMSTPVLDQPDRRTEADPSKRHGWVVPTLAAAATVAVVATAGLWVTGPEDGAAPGMPQAAPSSPAAIGPTPTESPVQGADDVANPMLLLDDPAWRVRRVHEEGPLSGEMTFTDGSSVLEVFWKPARDHQMYLEDRGDPVNARWPFTLLGLEGTLFRYGDSTDFTTILQPQDGVFLEIRGDQGSKEAYVDLVRRLTPVDSDAWSAALPARVVGPAEAGSVIAEMLADIPVPEGFDVTVLDTGLTVERYQLGATVAGAAACSWMDIWDDGVKGGDQAAADEAVTAMQSSRQWSVLRGMDEQGDYPEEVWDVAYVVSHDAELQRGQSRSERGWWVGGLGCDRPPRSLNMD